MPSFVVHAYALLLGLVLGSFANVCIHRVPRGKSVMRPSSRCPRCGTELRWWQNVPLVSFALLRGRCGHCRRPISWRYPAVEALTGGLFLAASFQETTGVGGVLTGFFLFVLVVVSVIDLDWQIIPDIFSLGLLGTSLVCAPLNPILGPFPAGRVVQAGAGALIGFFSAWGLSAAGRRLFHREALGGGDVKLLAGLGALLGWSGVVSTWFFSSLLGTAVFLGLKCRGHMTWGQYLPFGPFLAAGAWVHWTWPGLWGLWWGR